MDRGKETRLELHSYTCVKTTVCKYIDDWLTKKLHLKSWTKNLTCEQQKDTKILSNYTCVDAF